ncbi:MAG: glycosyltransferase, partial [Clostridiaceae bacterium]|nr:glycosyltransferase [Clostridiaceae bacterium]
MKLSICMMVKDEEKNLDRCLNSLVPLLEKVDGELIIVDTGSKDGTVEIAKKYTDKIYFKQWYNDFSGMRNYSTSLAKGEWIFIVDADEELQDGSLLAKFLQK